MKHSLIVLTLAILTFLFHPTPVLAQGTDVGIQGFFTNILVWVDGLLVGFDCTRVGDLSPNNPHLRALKIACAAEANNSVESAEEAQIGEVTTISTATALLPSTYKGITTVATGLPVSAKTYVADVVNNLNPAVRPAYAQEGLGFSSLEPVLGIWKVTRNLANFFVVIAFLVTGFAIMFRAKLGAQTAINIQNALPQLIVTLLLINFSYAIAGLLIDLMYISIWLIANLAQGTLTNGTGENSAIHYAFSDNIFSKMLGSGGIAWSASDHLGNLIQGMITLPTFNGVGKVLGELLGGLSSILFFLIIVVVLIIYAFKTFFALLGAYIQIILAVIFAPFQLLLHAYPGSRAFSDWLRNLAAHLAVFPVVIFMFFIARALLGLEDVPDNVGYSDDQLGFVPPLLRFGAGGGVSQAGAFQGLIALGMMLAMPQVVDKVKSAFGVGGGGGGGGGGFLGGMLGGAAGAGVFAPVLNPISGMGRSVASMYKGAIMSSALSGAGTALNEGGGWRSALGGAIKGGARGVYNPVGVNWEALRLRLQRQTAQDKYYGLNTSTNKAKTSKKQIRQWTDTLNQRLGSRSGPMTGGGSSSQPDDSAYWDQRLKSTERNQQPESTVGTSSDKTGKAR